VKVLLVAAEAPFPPVTGFRLVVGTLLARLPDRHDVRLLAFQMPDQAPGPLPVPATLLPWPQLSRVDDLRDLARGAVTGRPLRPDRLAALVAPHVQHEIERFQPDVVHVVSERLAALGSRLEGVPTVLTPLDAWHRNVAADARASSGLRGWLLRGEVARVERYEAREYRRFGAVTVVSAQDADALRRLAPDLPLVVVPNGVDLDRYRPRPELPREPHRIAFHGVMRYAPNVTAAQYLVDDVLPLVRTEVPQATVALVGRDPAPEILALAGDHVEVTGEVDDVVPWLAGARVYACLMRSGTGIKNKLLEAMACGLPAVVTPLALQGMQVEPGVDAVVADDAASAAMAITALLRDDGHAARIAAAGRAYVQQHHSWEAAVAAYEACYDRVTGSRA